MALRCATQACANSAGWSAMAVLTGMSINSKHCAPPHGGALPFLQVTLDQSRVAKLEIGALSAIATVGTTLNVTRSTFTGTQDL